MQSPINTDLCCPVCNHLNFPIKDLIECIECEKVFHKNCVKNEKRCPCCRNTAKPIFKKKISELRKKEL